MTSNSLTVILLIVSSLTLLGLAGVLFFLFRLQRTSDQRSESTLSILPSTRNREIEPVNQAPLSTHSWAPDNVVTRLSFRDSLNAEKFIKASRDSSLSEINRALAENAGDGIAITVNAVKLTKSSAEMVVTATKNGQELLKQETAVIARDAAGKALPMLKNVKTGKIMENMKEAASAKTLAKVASLSTMVVGAAHIISGADIANTLKEHGAKLDLLLEYRRIDQLAQLERIYISAQELCAGPMTEAKCWELWRLRGELRELRVTWRREYEHLLSKIDDPESAAWYQKLFNWIPPVGKGVHQEVHDRIKEGQHHVILIDYSLRMEQVFAVASRTVPEFEASLGGELKELQSLADLLKSKGKYISDEYSDLSVESTHRGLSAIAKEYKRLLPESMPKTDLEEIKAVQTEEAEA